MGSSDGQTNGKKPAKNVAMGRTETDDENIRGKKELRFPLIGYLPNKIRNHIIAFLGEFVGTWLFMFFAFAATQVANAAQSGLRTGSGSINSSPNVNTLLYISLAFGFSLAVNVWVFFRISGGMFNPAVTLGMVLIGAVTPIRAVVVFIAQLCGAMASAGIVSALFPGPLNVATTLGPGTGIARGLFIEMFLTAELVFTIFMLAAEKHKGTYLAPIGIGLALFVAELTGVYFTGGSLNPARSFGPAVIVGFPRYHWIYWVGPFLGSLLAVAFYRFVKTLEYETANPGQDFNEKEAEVFEFDEENAATGADVARPIVTDEPRVQSSDLERGMSAGSGGSSSGRPGTAGNTVGRVASGSEKVRPGSGNDAAYREGPAAELGGNYLRDASQTKLG